MLDRRQFPRRRTLLEGKVEVQKLNGWGVTCAVRNISEDGARLDLPANPVVPQAFQLSISGQAPRSARLIWFKDGQAGVALN